MCLLLMKTGHFHGVRRLPELCLCVINNPSSSSHTGKQDEIGFCCEIIQDKRSSLFDAIICVFHVCFLDDVLSE